jgi:DNA-binding NtrC family response regulator
MSAIRLLIVDDEERFLSTYKKLLEKRGISTTTCTNGSDAMRILEQRPIDVVLLDMKMPGIGGMEVLRRIRQEHPEVETIMLTGHLSMESEAEGLKSGAFDYLMKPSTISEIMGKVQAAYESKLLKEKRDRKTGSEDRSRRPGSQYVEKKA